MNTDMKKIFILAFLLPMFTACEDMIETYPYGQIDDGMMEGYPNIVKGLVGYAYEQLPRGYRDIQGNRLDCLTDDAVITSMTSNEYRFATGSANSSQNPFSNIWTSHYKAIANLNQFLKDDMGYKTKYYYDEKEDYYYRRLLKGEAFGLRAYLQWELLKLWGGRGIKSGELLGFPIITDRINLDTPETDLKRNTYAECVQQIYNDCDSAMQYLPKAHRDYLLTEEEQNYKKILGTCNWGRVDKMTMYAILADMYLTYASPLFNPEGDADRWKKAAEYAYKVIEFKNEELARAKSYYSSTNKEFPMLDWFDPTTPNAVFISRRLNNGKSTSHESDFYPGGVKGKFSGNGVLGATQDLVEAFYDKYGHPVDKNSEAYKTDPYTNRDPRLEKNIFYPGSKTTFNYTFETWAGEKDEPGLPKVSRTGNHIRKMVYANLKPNDASLKSADHCKIFYRWENMLLIFAEAAFEYGKNVNQTFEGCGGLTPVEALRTLRNIYFEDNIDDTDNPYDTKDYIDIAKDDEAKFRELIHNERRLEFCFEGVRFFDIRRWNTDVQEINKPVHMIEVKVTKDENGLIKTKSYETKRLEQRNFPSLYLPIPVTEIQRASNMEQNEGWDNWQS